MNLKRCPLSLFFEGPLRLLFSIVRNVSSVSSRSQLLFEGVTYLDGEAMSPHQSNHVLKVKVNKVKYKSISGQLRKPKTKRMTTTIKHRPKMVSSSIRDDSFQPEAL